MNTESTPKMLPHAISSALEGEDVCEKAGSSPSVMVAVDVGIILDS